MKRCVGARVCFFGVLLLLFSTRKPFARGMVFFFRVQVLQRGGVCTASLSRAPGCLAQMNEEQIAPEDTSDGICTQASSTCMQRCDRLSFAIRHPDDLMIDPCPNRTGTSTTLVHVLRREHGAAGHGLPGAAGPGVRGAGHRRRDGAVGDRGGGLRRHSSRHSR